MISDDCKSIVVEVAALMMMATLMMMVMMMVMVMVLVIVMVMVVVVLVVNQIAKAFGTKGTGALVLVHPASKLSTRHQQSTT